MPRNRLIRWFNFGHYQEATDERSVVAAEVKVLAQRLDGILPESAEKTAGMRKLLEAKDCFVRAAIEAGDSGDPPA